MTDTCSISGCNRPARARGWCMAHYDRWRRHGDVLADVPIGGNGPTHGRVSTYIHCKCRCVPCRQANANRMRAARVRRARYPAEVVPHGRYGYQNYLCRCQMCTSDWMANMAEQQTRRAGRVEDVPHGTQSGFRFWACRCDDCKDAMRKRQRRRRRTYARQQRSRQEAHRHGYEWTGPELEIVVRPNLSTAQKARMLGRTIMAVRHMARCLEVPTGRARRMLEGRSGA